MSLALDKLNYRHLYYFWMAAREGGIARASVRLRLTHPTLSAQIHELETQLGERLLERRGRHVVPTEFGKVAFSFADEIFGLGREMLDTLRSRPSGRPLRLSVGVVDALPKNIVRELVEPGLRVEGGGVRLLCREGPHDRLVAELTLHELDLVLSDSPVGPAAPARAFSHLLGECGVTLLARRDLARTLRRGFPRSLDNAPALLPIAGSSLRNSFDAWCAREGLRPRIVAEFDDPALLTVFAEDGYGLFPTPEVIADIVRQQHRLEVVGSLGEVHARFYAITVERRLRHPSVVAISEAARGRLFARPRDGAPH